MARNTIASQFLERVFCALCYLTMGIFALVWLIASYVLKKTNSQFALYNIYQSIMFSFFMFIIGWLFNIMVGLVKIVPLIGALVWKFYLFFCATPIYFNHTLSGLIVLIIVTFLALVAFFGRYPYIPYISEAIKGNLRR